MIIDLVVGGLETTRPPWVRGRLDGLAGEGEAFVEAMLGLDR